ncbi:unnamed protein product [Ectocarpus sp. 6 AP-2014]
MSASPSRADLHGISTQAQLAAALAVAVAVAVALALALDHGATQILFTGGAKKTKRALLNGQAFHSHGSFATIEGTLL